MITDPDDFEPAGPVCGILSIAAPVMGFALAIVSVRAIRASDILGVGAFFCIVAIMPIAFLVGAILGIVALRRHVRYRALPVVGLVLSLGPLLLGFIGAVLTIIGKG
jgi:hypothetical protein